MTRLNGRVERLEQGDGRYCTIGDLIDAVGDGDRMDALKPIDPRVQTALSQLGLDDAGSRLA